MSPGKRLGSDPLSWMKEQGQNGAPEEAPAQAPGEEFKTPQETIDEICALNQAPLAEPAWRPRQVLDRLGLALCVYGADKEVLYANPAWFSLTCDDPAKPGAFLEQLGAAGEAEDKGPTLSRAELPDGRVLHVEHYGMRDPEAGVFYHLLTVTPGPVTAPQAAEPLPVEPDPEPPATDGEVMSLISAWGIPGPEMREIIEAFARSQPQNLLDDQLPAQGLVLLLHNCARILEDHLQLPAGSIKLDTRVRMSGVGREQAVLASVTLMEILRLSLGWSGGRPPKDAISLIVSGDPAGRWMIRLYSPSQLKPSKLAFTVNNRNQFAYLAEVVTANQGALLSVSGRTEELRVTF